MVLDKVPAGCWHRATLLARRKMHRTLVRRFSPLASVPSGANFQITRGRHAIIGGTATDPEVAAVVVALQGLLVRAIGVEPR